MKVVLHTEKKFSGPAGVPNWADTLFDHTSGSIHLPIQSALDDLALFSRVVRHQFVHALFHEQAKNGSTSPPTWLVEGLAIHLTEDPSPHAAAFSSRIVGSASLNVAIDRIPHGKCCHSAPHRTV
jgi:hypothetical protein